MKPRRHRIHDWLLLHIPAGLLARPWEIFWALLCALSGLLIIVGTTKPTSVAALLPPAVYYAWGASLLIGGFAMTWGISSYKRMDDVFIVTRPAVYRLGLRLLGLSAFVYGTAGLLLGGWNALLFTGVLYTFAASCGIRLLTLGERSE